MSNTTEVRGVEFKACYCGCGQPVGSRSMYRPGHDARHAGAEARRVAEMVLQDNGNSSDVDDPELYNLPTPALFEKAVRMASRLVAKERGPKVVNPAVQAKLSRHAEALHAGDPADTPQTGSIKIGRWTYPARMSTAGRATRNEKRDGSGAWIALSPNAASNIDWS